MKAIDTDFMIEEFQYRPVVLVTIGGYETLVDPNSVVIDLETVRFKDYGTDEYIVVGAPSELEEFVKLIDRVEEMR